MEHNYSDLIIGYLKGTLVPEDIERFYVWVNANPENKKVFFEAKMIYDVCQSNNGSLDINKSWKRLLAKQRSRPSGKFRLLYFKTRMYAAVAILAVALTSTLFLTLYNTSSAPVAKYVSGDGLVADKVILPDGTQISMGSQSTFRYDSQYGKEERKVYLKGEAFFDVAKQKDKPFIVVVNGQEIEALGTKFNVEAYPSDSVAVTTLLEGSIRLVSAHIKTPTVLAPNQQYIYNRNKGTCKVNEVEASLYTSWISGYYYFHEEGLKEILSRLGHIYGVNFQIQSEKLKGRKFTGTFYRGQNIKDILDIINISIPIQYRIDKRDVIIN